MESRNVRRTHCRSITALQSSISGPHLSLFPLWSKHSWKDSCLSYPVLHPQHAAWGRHLLKQSNLKWKNGNLHSGLFGRNTEGRKEEDSGTTMTQTSLPPSPCSIPVCLLLSTKWLPRPMGSWTLARPGY